MKEIQPRTIHNFVDGLVGGGAGWLAGGGGKTVRQVGGCKGGYMDEKSGHEILTDFRSGARKHNIS